jgi:hypothetical protein
VRDLARRSCLGIGEHAGEKRRGGAEKRKKLRVAVRRVKRDMRVARACVSRTGKCCGFTTPASRAEGAVQNALDVSGCGRNYFLYLPLKFHVFYRNSKSGAR